MEWELQSSEGACAKCGREFSHREEYYSALYACDEGFERKDYCVPCWGKGRPDVFSFWRARAKKEPDPPKRFVNDEVLIEFFDRLSGVEDPRKKRLAFIMAILLLRKRLLREKGRRRRADGTYWILRCPATEKEYEVKDQGLCADETVELIHEMGRVLNINLQKHAEDSLENA